MNGHKLRFEHLQRVLVRFSHPKVTGHAGLAKRPCQATALSFTNGANMHRIVQYGFLLVVFAFTVSACSQSDPVVAPLHETDKGAVESGALGADGSGLVTKPFRGQYATTFTLPTTPPPFLEFYIWGEGVATLLGSSSWEGPSYVDLTQIPPVQTSIAMFTAADGSQILMTAVGISVPVTTLALEVSAGRRIPHPGHRLSVHLHPEPVVGGAGPHRNAAGVAKRSPPQSHVLPRQCCPGEGCSQRRRARCGEPSRENLG